MIKANTIYGSASDDINYESSNASIIGNTIGSFFFFFLFFVNDPGLETFSSVVLSISLFHLMTLKLMY